MESLKVSGGNPQGLSRIGIKYVTYVHFKKGMSFWRIRNYNQAIKHLAIAAMWDPKDIFVIYSLVLILQDLQYWDYAKLCLQFLLEINPKDHHALIWQMIS